MLKKIQLYHIFLFIVSLMPLLSIYLTIPDIFHYRRDELVINGIISAVCFLITMGTFIFFLFKKKIALFTLFCAILCTAFGWVYFYIDRPAVRADWIKKSYLRNPYLDYTNYSSEIHDDFTNVKIRDLILKDEVFIGKMMERMSIDNSYKWEKVAHDYFKQNEYKKHGLMLLLALRYQGKSDKQILEMPYGEELLLAVFLNELQPVYVKKGITLPLWAEEILRKKPSALFKQGAVSQELWHNLVKKRLSQVEKMGTFSCEMFLCLLTRIPTKIEKKEFSKLMNYWASLNPTYKKEILALAEKRNKIYEIGQKIARNDTLFIDFHLYKGQKDILLLKPDNFYNFCVLTPLIISAGFIPVVANESQLESEKLLAADFKITTDLLKSEMVDIYKDVARTRTRRVGVKYERTVTETYYEKQRVGSEQEDTYSYFYVIKFKIKDSQSFADSILTFESLSHQYFDKQKKIYTIDDEQRARNDYWLYALPYDIPCNIY